MNAEQLASKIRDRVDLNYSQKVHPDRRHLHDTAVAVAAVLGMVPDAHNIGHLMGLLATHETRQEYPKMKFRGGESRIIHSADEEEALGEEWSDERQNGGRR